MKSKINNLRKRMHAIPLIAEAISILAK